MAHLAASDTDRRDVLLDVAALKSATICSAASLRSSARDIQGADRGACVAWDSIDVCASMLCRVSGSTVADPIPKDSYERTAGIGL